MAGFFDLGLGDPTTSQGSNNPYDALSALNGMGGVANSLPLLGLLQGLGAAAAPSRLPVPLGMALGQAAQGYQSGLLSQQQYQQSVADTAIKKADADRYKAFANYIASRRAAGNSADAAVTPDSSTAAAATTPTTAVPTPPTGPTPPPTPGALNAPAAPPGPRLASLIPATTTPVDYTSYSDKVMPAESGGAVDAKNPLSSAAGPGQFINKTWIAQMRQMRPDLANLSDQQILALRTDQTQGKPLAKAATINYAQQNAPVLQASNIPINDTTLYAAHYLGAGGATKVLNAPADTPMAALVSPQVIAANPQMANQTNTQFINGLAKKMGQANLAGPTPATTQPTQVSAQPTQTPAPPAAAPTAAASNDPFASMSPEMLAMLGPDAASKLAMSQKHQLTPAELKAEGLPEGTVAEKDITGHTDVVYKPVATHVVPQEEWAQYGVDKDIVPKGTILTVNDQGVFHVQYPPSGSTTNLTPDAIKDGAFTYITTGKFQTGMRDKASMQAIQNFAATLRPPDMSREDWAWLIQNNGLALHARQAAAGRIATAGAQTAVNEGTVNNSISILRQMMPVAASHGPFTDVNDFEQWVGRKTNDPNAVKLKNAIDTITNEYARVMTGSTTGAPSSDSARSEAAERLMTGYNQGTLDQALGLMQQEMRGRSDYYNNVLSQLSGGRYGGAPIPINPNADLSSAAPAKPVAPGATAIPGAMPSAAPAAAPATSPGLAPAAVTPPPAPAKIPVPIQALLKNGVTVVKTGNNGKVFALSNGHIYNAMGGVIQ